MRKAPHCFFLPEILISQQNNKNRESNWGVAQAARALFTGNLPHMQHTPLNRDYRRA